MNNERISLSVYTLFNKYSVEESCKMLKEAGFTAIELDLDALWCRPKVWKGELPKNNILEKSPDEIYAYFKDKLDCLKKYGITINQAHAPFPACLPDQPHVLEYAIKVYKNCIGFMEKIGAKYLVIHGVSLYEWDKISELDDIKALNKKLYTSLIPELQKTNVVVCLENMEYQINGNVLRSHCSDPNDAVVEIEELNKIAGKECFGYCLDTGHINVTRNNSMEFIKTLGSHLKCLHLNDNWGVRDEHKMPFAGDGKQIELKRALKSIGYSGNYNFEVTLLVPKPLYLAHLKFIAKVGEYFRSPLEN